MHGQQSIKTLLTLYAVKTNYNTRIFRFLMISLGESSLLCFMQLGSEVGYVKTQLSCILHYYADDEMFRPLWVIFRSQKMYNGENYTVCNH